MVGRWRRGLTVHVAVGARWGYLAPMSKPRVKLNLNLAADVAEALKTRSAETDVPLGRIVDAAVRAHLKLPKPEPVKPVR